MPRIKNKEITAKKAVLNTTINEVILKDFKQYCENINMNMNSVLEIFMLQFAKGQFSFRLVKNRIDLDSNIIAEEMDLDVED